MELMKISHVVDVLGAKAADDYLKLGWIVVSISPKRDENGMMSPLYYLGWPIGKGKAEYPPDIR